MHKSFNKESIRCLRLRLGWSQADLARNMGCSTELVVALEQGNLIAQGALSSELEIIEKHADQLSEELHAQPLAENKMEEAHLEQMDTTRFLAEL